MSGTDAADADARGARASVSNSRVWEVARRQGPDAIFQAGAFAIATAIREHVMLVTSDAVFPRLRGKIAQYPVPNPPTKEITRPAETTTLPAPRRSDPAGLW